jgi:hypothetical protein
MVARLRCCLTTAQQVALDALLISLWKNNEQDNDHAHVPARTARKQTRNVILLS